jgi:hypothetical protein
VKEEDPFPNLTDDDVRRGFETLLGNVPRASHPGVQQLGFRGYFKQKVEEMNARELFPTTSTPAQKEKEAGSNSNVGEFFPTSEENFPRARLTCAQKGGGTQKKDAGEKSKARTSRRETEAVDGNMIRLSNLGGTSDKKKQWEPPLSAVHGKRRDKRQKSEKGSDAIKAEGFIKDLLARWEEVSVRDARRAFIELNGWEPNDAILGRGSADLKAWYRGKLEGMVQKGRRYVRVAVNRPPWLEYRWPRWGKAQFSENVESSAGGETAQIPEGMNQSDAGTQEKRSSREESMVDGNAGDAKSRKRAPQEETLVGSKRRKTAEGAEVRGKAAAMRGREARGPSVIDIKMTSPDPNMSSEDPAAAVIRGLLRRWAAADLEEIARVFAQLNGWSPTESYISRSNQDAKGWYEEKFRKMTESGKRLIRLDEVQGDKPITPGACLPACYCYRHWTEVGEGARAESGAREKGLQVPSLEEADEDGGREFKGMGSVKSAREKPVGSLVTKGTSREESEPDAPMEEEEIEASDLKESSRCGPAGVFSVAKSGGNGNSEEGVSEKLERENDAAMAGSVRAALQDEQEESNARAAR